MDLLLHSAQLFIYRTVSSILLSPSPAQYFNPARMNREIKKQKMRHDERGSQRSAGCGQVKRWCVLRTVEGRHTGWRFLISAGPLLHFLEPDTVFCGGQMRLGGKKTKQKKNTPRTPAVYPFYSATYLFPSLLCSSKENTHKGTGSNICSQVCASHSHQFTHQTSKSLSKFHSSECRNLYPT